MTPSTATRRFFSAGLVDSHRPFTTTAILDDPLPFVGVRLPYYFVHALIASDIVDNPGSAFEEFGLDLSHIRATWFIAPSTSRET